MAKHLPFVKVTLTGRKFNANDYRTYPRNRNDYPTFAGFQNRLFANDLIEPPQSFAAFELDGELSMPTSSVTIPAGLVIDRRETINGKTVAVYQITTKIYRLHCSIAGLFARNQLLL